MHHVVFRYLLTEHSISPLPWSGTVVPDPEVISISSSVDSRMLVACHEFGFLSIRDFSSSFSQPQVGLVTNQTAGNITSKMDRGYRLTMQHDSWRSFPQMNS